MCVEECQSQKTAGCRLQPFILNLMRVCTSMCGWVRVCVREREREREKACVGFSAGREGDRETGKEFTFNYSCSYKRSFVKQCRKTDVQWLLTKRGNNNK